MANEELEKLLELIENGTISERNEAFEKLRDEPFESIKDFLFGGLRNNHHRIRTNCAKILGEKGDETIIFPLLQIMSDDSWAIRKSAQDALKHMDEEEILPALTGIINASSGNIPLLKSLAGALATFTHRDASGLLVSMIQNNEDPGLRVAVTKALGSRKDDLSISHLFYLLAHELWEIRQAAVRAISKMPFETVQNRLKKELANSNRFIHLSVIEILIAKGDDDVIDLMADALSSNNDNTRKHAMQVLAEIGNDDSYSLMISLLGDLNDAIRSRAIDVLGNSNSESVLKMLRRCLKSSNDRIKYGAIKALGKLGSDEAIDILADLLKSLEGRDKVHVLDSMATIGTRKCITLVVKNSSIPDFTKEVSEILQKLDTDLAIQQLVHLLEQSEFFATSVKALAELDKLRVLRYLSNRLGSGTPLQQEKAVEAMGLIGLRDAIPYLEKVLEGGFAPNIMRAANTSLRRLNKSGQ